MTDIVVIAAYTRTKPFRHDVLGSERLTRRTIRSPRPGTGNSPHAQRGPRICHQRSSPSQACGACTIAIVPVPVNAHTHPLYPTQHTLWPIRHSLFLAVRAFQRSKSSSPHWRLPNGAKSRKMEATRPSSVASPRESCPSSKNFCDVESWTVDSARARMRTPSCRVCLH